MAVLCSREQGREQVFIEQRGQVYFEGWVWHTAQMGALLGPACIKASSFCSDNMVVCFQSDWARR